VSSTSGPSLSSQSIGEAAEASQPPVDDVQEPTKASTAWMLASAARDAASAAALQCAAETAPVPTKAPADEIVVAPTTAVLLDESQPPLQSPVLLGLVQLPAECIDSILAALPLVSLTRARGACRSFRECTSRVIAAISTIDGSALSQSSPSDDLASAGLNWLLANGCTPTSATFGDEATDRMLAMLLTGPSAASLSSLDLSSCSQLTTLPELSASGGRPRRKPAAAHSSEAASHAAVAEANAAVEEGVGVAAIDITEDALPTPSVKLPLPALTRLSVVRCPGLRSRGLDDSLPRFVSRLSSIISLSLEGCTTLTDAGLAVMLEGRGPSLTKLCLNGCRALTPAAVDSLGALHSLTELEVGSCTALTSLDPVARGCTRLRKLNISLCKGFGSAALARLAEALPDLERLNLMGSGIGTEGLASVAQHCTALTWLNLTRCKEVDDDSTIMIALRCTSLRHLFLAACVRVTDITLQAVGGFCTDLEELQVAGCAGIGDDGLLAVAKGCRRLTTLSVDTCTGISDDSIAVLAANCANLESLQANGCPGLGDDTLLAIATHCKAMKRLDVRACSRVTEQGLAACAESVPKCKVFA
jgi:hypothetical protein